MLWKFGWKWRDQSYNKNNEQTFLSMKNVGFPNNCEGTFYESKRIIGVCEGFGVVTKGHIWVKAHYGWLHNPITTWLLVMEQKWNLNKMWKWFKIIIFYMKRSHHMNFMNRFAITYWSFKFYKTTLTRSTLYDYEFNILIKMHNGFVFLNGKW